MLRQLLLLSLLSGAATVSASQDAPEARISEDEEVIRSIYKEFEAAFREGDVDRMLSHIHDRAIFTWNQIEVIGREAVRRTFVENVSSIWRDANATHIISGVEFLSADVAVTWGNFVVVFRDGSRETGHFMNTLIKRDGTWLTASEQTCSANESVLLNSGDRN